jgi:signal peptidase complex subunit 2
MGKKKAAAVADAAGKGEKDDRKEGGEEHEHEEEEEEEEMELIKIETGDTLKVKQVMDEAVVRAVLECGLQEDHKWGNVKLFLMASACVFAAVAQFYPSPFPESRGMLAVCCVSYFLCSGLLQCVLSFIDADIIIRTLPEGDAPALVVQTDFPRFHDEFLLWIGNADDFKVFTAFWGRGGDRDPRTARVYKVGDYFDVDGNFDEQGLVDAVSGVITSHTSKKNK